MDLLAQTELAEQSRATSRIPSFYSCLWGQERMLETKSTQLIFPLLGRNVKRQSQKVKVGFKT